MRGELERLHAPPARAARDARARQRAARARRSTSRCRATPCRAARRTCLTQIQREIEDVFVGLGFRIAEGPEVELEYYNFTALNTPDDHPSRAESDTLWITPDVCLRTQTSPVQVRVMERSRRRST